eukprot:1667573-Pleurochrysis_carterae.AAC.1
MFKECQGLRDAWNENTSARVKGYEAERIRMRLRDEVRNSWSRRLATLGAGGRFRVGGFGGRLVAGRAAPSHAGAWPRCRRSAFKQHVHRLSRRRHG